MLTWHHGIIIAMASCCFELDAIWRLVLQGGCRDKNTPCMPNVNFNTKELTTNTGAPVISNEFSLRAGNRGMQHDLSLSRMFSHPAAFSVLRSCLITRTTDN